MEELLASLSQKKISLQQGQEIEGTVVAVLDKEILLDLSTKSEGVLPKREIPADILKNLKPGDSLKSYVVQVENESGQVTLAFHKPVSIRTRGGRGGRGIDWARFINAKNQNSKLSGQVLEINKGGLILEVEGIRGFLPGSQIGIDALGKLVEAKSDIVGQNLQAFVIEIDQNNNRLIFSQKGMVSEEVKSKLDSIKNGQEISGKVVVVYPFGAVVEASSQFFLVYPQDVTWEKLEDPTSTLKVGDVVKGKVLAVDKDYGRISLSLKALHEDPFTKISENFQTDDVVSVVVSGVSDQGVSFSLKDGVEGFMPSSKMESKVTYEVGQKLSCLVDSVDLSRRRVNLVPMLTSTEGLIYK